MDGDDACEESELTPDALLTSVTVCAKGESEHSDNEDGSSDGRWQFARLIAVLSSDLSVS